MSIVELIETEVTRETKVITTERSLNGFEMISGKFLSMSKATLAQENINILSEGAGNIFTNERRLSSMSKNLTIKEIRFLAKEGKDLVIILERLVMVRR